MSHSSLFCKRTPFIASQISSELLFFCFVYILFHRSFQSSSLYYCVSFFLVWICVFVAGDVLILFCRKTVSVSSIKVWNAYKAELSVIYVGLPWDVFLIFFFRPNWNFMQYGNKIFYSWHFFLYFWTCRLASTSSVSIK